MTPGRFIAIEGPDGSGKTSIIQVLRQKLEQDGLDAVSYTHL